MNGKRKNIQALFVSIILLFNLSCKSLKSTTELEQVFTKNEIKDLNRINNFFVKEYLNSSEKNFETSFKDMFQFTYSYGIDTLINRVDFNKQRKLYHSIHHTFDEIWEVKINEHEPFKGEEYIVPKYQGKFQLFLKQLSKTNTFANLCNKKMEESGDFNMLFFDNYIIHNFDKINFTDFNNQLIISIYYLSMVDDRERDERTKKRILEYNRKIKEQFENGNLKN